MYIYSIFSSDRKKGAGKEFDETVGVAFQFSRAQMFSRWNLHRHIIECLPLLSLPRCISGGSGGTRLLFSCVALLGRRGIEFGLFYEAHPVSILSLKLHQI